MAEFTDQTARMVIVDDSPSRIVSLVPSLTELLYDLGLNTSVAGITKFCIHPADWFRNKTRVGGTKQVNHERIKAIDPDLIIANKEENERGDVEILAQDYPVWVTDVYDFTSALNMIGDLSRITGTELQGLQLIDQIGANFRRLSKLNTPLKVCYLIWQEPFMTVGHDTFIHDMLQRCGFINAFGERARYPVVTIGEIATADCDLIMLSSEPFPFKERHAINLRQQLPGTRVLLVDGEMFSWYGSRLLKAAPYFQTLINTLQHGTGTSRQTITQETDVPGK